MLYILIFCLCKSYRVIQFLCTVNSPRPTMINGCEFKELLAFFCVNYSINVRLDSRNSPVQTGIEFPLKVNFHFKKFAIFNQFINYIHTASFLFFHHDNEIDEKCRPGYN